MTVMPAESLLTELGAPGAGSLAAVSREIIGPFAAALTPQPLPWDAGAAGAEVTVPAGARYPLLLLTLLTDLDDEQIVAATQLLGPATNQPTVTYAPWSQAGSSLPAFVPEVDSAGAAAAFRIGVTATRAAAGGSPTAFSPAEVRAAVRLDLVQGVAGRVLVAMLAEKARLRRCGREIAAMRALAVARDNALDRLGRDLDCPRFSDELVWDPVRRSPTAQPLSPPQRREDDPSYRARLQLLRSLRLATPDSADRLINGTPGAPGHLADVGFTGRIEVDETPNVLHLALRLISPGSAQGRATLLDAIRQVHLTWPADSAAGDTAHGRRLLPAQVADRVTATRAALARWDLPAGEPVAPSLARALETLEARCTQLGARPWAAAVAGQQDAGGSRLELGHGALLASPDAAQLDAAVTAATALGDPALNSVPRSADPVGAWLLAACGLRTAELTTDGSVFISTLPMGPLVVDVAPDPDATLPQTATAHLVSPTDAAHDAPLVVVMAAMAARGLTAVADVPGMLAGMQSATTQPAAAEALGRQGVPLVADVTGFRQQLAAVSNRLYVVFDLEPGGTAALTTDPSQLAGALAAAGSAGASSTVAVVTAAGTVALLFGVSGLPLAGSNLAARQTVLYRWQVRSLAGDAVGIDPRRGPATEIYAPGNGISVLSCTAHVRGPGHNDPYEWSPAPVGGALLNLRQYEHLMNLVELATPIGVRANTWLLRQYHLDVDGSGRATPLTATAARTYRRYRAAR
jgi:hypothetical protein